MTRIRTQGKDGKHYEFKYVIEDIICDTCKIPKRSFMVHFADDSHDDFFDFKLAQIDIKTVKITDMFLDSEYRFQGKGLPEAMILEAQKIYPSVQIISSTNKKEHGKVCNEWRSIPGSRVWERLVNKGLAKYDEKKDLYILNRDMN